jgi:hypothetical protein
MKKTAYVLLTCGFLLGAYSTSLDVQNVQWTLFIVAAVASVAGVVFAKRQDSALAQSDSVLQTNRSELNDSIANIVRDLEAITERDTPTGDQLRAWIDDKLRPDLRRFAEARESMVHLYGLQTYADIMSEFAAGERYVNRVWTSSADGYDAEASKYLARAAQQFKDAQAQLSAAGAA